MLYDSEDDLDEHEYPDEDDVDGDLLPCPHCKELIYDDAPQCLYCGQYVTHTTSPFSGRPSWWVAIGVFGIVSVLLVVSGIISILFGRN